MAWAGPVDRPGARTSHAAPTPTSGGLAILAGASLGLLAFSALAPGAAGLRPAARAMGCACAFGLFGAWDDAADLGARLKLLLGAALALGFAAVAPVRVLPLTASLSLPLGPELGVLGAALWIVTATNAVNFMDGANGVAPGGTAVAFAALAAAAFAAGAPGLGAAALAGAAATGGYLPWNLRGRLFQGDAGALFGGYLFAALCLEGAGPDGRGPIGLWFGPLAILPFLADVLLTLARRARGRRPLLSAHREHLYQRWLQATGRSHAALARRTTALTAATAAAAALLSRLGPGPALAGFVAGVLGLSLGWTVLGRRLDRSAATERTAERAHTEP